MYGTTLPDGMRDNQILPQPIITPTSKEFDGGHDAPLTPTEIIEGGLLTELQWKTLSEYAFALFARGQQMALERGLILVDTKYEFGVDEAGTIILADEIHTPTAAATGLPTAIRKASRRGPARQASTRTSSVAGSPSVATRIGTKYLKFLWNWWNRPRRSTSRLTRQ